MLILRSNSLNKNLSLKMNHLISGDIILRTKMVVEKLGSWKDPCAYDGSRYWSGPRR